MLWCLFDRKYKENYKYSPKLKINHQDSKKERTQNDQKKDENVKERISSADELKKGYFTKITPAKFQRHAYCSNNERLFFGLTPALN